MKKSVFQKFINHGSAYIPADKDGRIVIRISNHMPTPIRLFYGDITGKCENIYLIFVKSKIEKEKEGGIKLTRLIQLKESNNPKERIQGEIELNNILVNIGNSIKKGINYQIIDGNSKREIEKATDNAVKMLKTTVFIPLEYIFAIK